MDNSKKTVRLPNLFEAILPVLTMVGLMIYVFNFSDRTYDGAHMPLIIGIIVGSIVGIMCGHTWSDMVAGMIQRLDATLEAILILLTVGLLISSFMISGTIPALIYYGLDILTPKLFLPVGCLLVALVGLACGSSWTATGTILSLIHISEPTRPY